MLSSVGPVRLPDAANAVSTAQLWSVLNATSAGMALLTAVRTPDDPVRGAVCDFRYQLANVAHASLTAFRYDELAGRCVSEVFPNYLHHPFFTLLAEAVRTQQPASWNRPTRPTALMAGSGCGSCLTAMN